MNNFVIIKHEHDGLIAQFSKKKKKGLQFSPRNQDKYPLLKVDQLMVFNPSFIDKILKKKNQRRLDYYLNYIISLIDIDDSDDDDTVNASLDLALNDLTHYKSIVEYKYRKYMDQKYIELLLKKINILENEIKMKKLYYQNTYTNTNEYEEHKGKSR